MKTHAGARAIGSSQANDNRLYIICAMHKIGQDWASRYGFPVGSYKTITQAPSLLGLNRAARIVWLKSNVEHPDALIIQRELKRRFTNVQYLDEHGSPYTA